MGYYFYNGTELPPLPEWDKKTYPYACITLSADGSTYRLSFHSVQLRYDHPYRQYTSSQPYHHCVYSKFGYVMYYKIVDGQWVRYYKSQVLCILAYSYSVETKTAGPTVIWTSYNIMRVDSGNYGKIHMYGSDPVPVPPTVSSLSPASMLSGWYAGRRMALMHPGHCTGGSEV